jgi:rhodanese-related sulfurtransferase
MKHNAAFLALVAETKARIREVDIDSVIARRERGDAFVLLDVREQDEWSAGRIPGAVYLGRGVLERDIETRYPDLETDLVLYCGGGFRSALAADNLMKMGYRKVASMEGGIRDWRERGFLVDESKIA